MSLLQKRRQEYKPLIPDFLSRLDQVCWEESKEDSKKPDSRMREWFPNTFDTHPFVLKRGEGNLRPLTIGALFSGGQAAGGHNVLGGLFHALKSCHGESRLFGFLNGSDGFLANHSKELTDKQIASHLNQGGFDLLGSSRTKIETPEQLAVSESVCRQLRLDGLVIIGGDDSNTNAAILAEYFLEHGCATKVIGVPKTIDGDLQSLDIEISFGFDSACKTYSELIGNIAKDAISAKKYYHFIKLMGRSASHITLECALATQPNLVLIGEERKSLREHTLEIADLICKRFDAGKQYGVILVPEGLIESIPEIRSLIEALNGILAEDRRGCLTAAAEKLEPEQKASFSQLPDKIQGQLLLERDSHGNVQVSQIDTQTILLELVREELRRRGWRGSFAAQDHFFGYEGRSCFPSNFDANYCYTLGLLATLAVRDGLTGMICSVQGLRKQHTHWRMKAVPIIRLMHLETRKGKEKPVIQKTLVDLKGKAYKRFSQLKKGWEIEDCYRYPGPIQFFGDQELTDAVPLILTAGTDLLLYP